MKPFKNLISFNKKLSFLNTGCRFLEHVSHVFIKSFDEEIQYSHHNRQLADNKIAFSLSNTFTQIFLYKMLCLKTAENLFLHGSVFRMSLSHQEQCRTVFLSFFSCPTTGQIRKLTMDCKI